MPKNDKKEQKMAEKSRKDNKKQTKKVLKIPNPPEYFVGYSLKKWNELAPIFAEKAAKISEISTNALFSVVKLIP